ncbi:acyltransferase family protein [Sphingomonas hylomeconis]|uniref:Acyltransferase family protein n=1 Tax=Sphingomonas hylomeconis TaxID=1395958 RepID=A0ABV7STX0_9SPHN|nr:acyltransferase [Sphingomonas hylomeconis]
MTSSTFSGDPVAKAAKREANRDFLPNIQIARFLAAGLVIVGHLQFITRDRGIMLQGALVDFRPIYNPVGVDIFFVISGFIMYYLSQDHFAQPGYARAFLKRRLIRIVPLYWLFTTMTIGVALAAPHLMNHSAYNAPRILASYLFIPWPRIDGNIVPMHSSGWTLNYEMLFYAAFAVAILLGKRRGITFLFALFVTAMLLNPFIPRGWFVLEFWTRQIIGEFLIGIMLARLYLSGFRLQAYQAWSCVALGLAYLVAEQQWHIAADYGRLLGLGLPAALLSFGIIFGPTPTAPGRLFRLAVLCGDASYSLYLSHPYTINVLVVIWRKLGLGMPYLFFALAVAGSIVVSILLYTQFELRIVKLLNRLTRARAVQQAAPA